MYGGGERPAHKVHDRVTLHISRTPWAAGQRVIPREWGSITEEPGAEQSCGKGRRRGAKETVCIEACTGDEATEMGDKHGRAEKHPSRHVSFGKPSAQFLGNSWQQRGILWRWRCSCHQKQFLNINFSNLNNKFVLFSL